MIGTDHDRDAVGFTVREDRSTMNPKQEDMWRQVFLAIKTSEGAAICVTWNSHRVWWDFMWQELSCIPSLQAWTGCFCQQRLERKHDINLFWFPQTLTSYVANGETVRVAPHLINWRILRILLFCHSPSTNLSIIYPTPVVWSVGHLRKLIWMLAISKELHLRSWVCRSKAI